MTLGIIGTGAVGSAMAALARNAGQEVVLAGRSAPAALEDAVQAEMVMLAIPYTAAREVLMPLQPVLAGRIVIDPTNPLGPDWSPLDPGPAGSAAGEIAALLPQSRVVKAFNTVFADIMNPAGLDRQGRRATTFIASDHEGAAQDVGALASRLGFDPVQVGPLRVARHLEELAHLNIAIAAGMGGGTGAAILYHRA